MSDRDPPKSAAGRSGSVSGTTKTDIALLHIAEQHHQDSVKQVAFNLMPCQSIMASSPQELTSLSLVAS